MDPIFSIALSGLNAATRRLDVSAANVANADSIGALPDPVTGAPGNSAPFQPLTVNRRRDQRVGRAVEPGVHPELLARFALRQ